ncbi:MAG: tetratricopeptide repeat protein, partial [Polyangiaceae bacterium]|nr:tetratricopeptide repeat protein [Polyangiaceae bacterium]
MQWLASTDGLGQGCVWLSFQDIRSAEYVLNRLGEPLFGADFAAAPPEQKVGPLAKALREIRLLVVWDNFEVVCGAAGFEATLSEADRGLLRELLSGLRGGKTKVILTSRSEEAWLGPELRRKIAVGGLDKEERWEYCETILRELGVRADRDDRDLVELLDLLGGHPLAMRVVLLRMEKGQRAGELVSALRSNLLALEGEGDEAQRKLYATLKLAEEALPEELKPLLVPLGMHEGHVDGDYLEAMARQVDEGWTRARIDRFLVLLVNAGLLRDLGQAVHEMHPALTGFLRAAVLSRVVGEERDRWSRAYVDVMGSLADAFAPEELHEQREPFYLFGTSFYHALGEAERLGMQTHQCALLQSLGRYAQNTRRFSEATMLYERLARAREAMGNPAGEAAAYHQLGRVAQGRRDFDAAERWYKKSLDINEKHGNEHGAANSYHELGIVAQERRDFDAAERWY